MSSSQMVDLDSLYFIFYFYFYFVLFSYFSIFRTARVRVRSDQLYCHISHNMIVWSQHWLRDLENRVEDSRTNDVIQHEYHMLTSCSTHGHLG